VLGLNVNLQAGTSRVPLSPVQLGGTDWTQVTDRPIHPCAIKNDGTLWCWVANLSGASWANDKRCLLPTSQPSDFRFRSPAPPGSSVSAGLYPHCAIIADGNALVLGSNSSGQLGDNVRTQRARPAVVSSGQDLAYSGRGRPHTCALATDGSLWCWATIVGSVGIGSNERKRSPPVSPNRRHGWVRGEIVSQGTSVRWCWFWHADSAVKGSGYPPVPCTWNCEDVGCAGALPDRAVALMAQRRLESWRARSKAHIANPAGRLDPKTPCWPSRSKSAAALRIACARSADGTTLQHLQRRGRLVDDAMAGANVDYRRGADRTTCPWAIPPRPHSTEDPGTCNLTPVARGCRQ